MGFPGEIQNPKKNPDFQTMAVRDNKMALLQIIINPDPKKHYSKTRISREIQNPKKNPDFQTMAVRDTEMAL